MLAPGLAVAAEVPSFTSPARTCDFLSASLMPIRARPPEGSGTCIAIFFAASSAAAVVAPSLAAGAGSSRSCVSAVSALMYSSNCLSGEVASEDAAANT